MMSFGGAATSERVDCGFVISSAQVTSKGAVAYGAFVGLWGAASQISTGAGSNLSQSHLIIDSKGAARTVREGAPAHAFRRSGASSAPTSAGSRSR